MDRGYVNAVSKAVVKWGHFQFFQLASELGLNRPQIRAVEFCIPSTAGKLRALIETKKGGVGDAKLVDDLFRACSRLDEPIIENVKRELESQGFTVELPADITDDKSVDSSDATSAGVAHGAANGTLSSDVTNRAVDDRLSTGVSTGVTTGTVSADVDNEATETDMMQLSSPESISVNGPHSSPQGSPRSVRLSRHDRLNEKLVGILQYIGCGNQKWIDLGKSLLGWTEERVEDIPSGTPDIRDSQKLEKVFLEWMMRDGEGATIGRVFDAYEQINKLGDVKSQLETNGYFLEP